ncbi:MAG: hypothetical protein ACHQF0_00835 [Chitinophagales bacterium]
MRYFVASLVFLLLSSCLAAQDFLPDSVVYRLALNQTFAYNDSRIIKTSGLYTGSQYVRDYYNVKGHPFFQTDSLEKGDVFYNGVLYRNVNLLYDLSHDNVITEYSGDTKIVLIPEKTDYFILSSHFFERQADPLTAGEGFYDLLLNDEIKILAKRVKRLNTYSGSPGSIPFFMEIDNYFLYKDSSYHSVNNKKELLEALKNKKAELKDFISKNKPDFKRNFENTLIQTARYYEQISK